MTKTIIAITFLATILFILPIASIPVYAPHPITVIPSGVSALPLNGNCYAAVPLPGGFGRTFGAAFTAAPAQSVNGIPGHLATLNTPAEQALSLAFPQGWIGHTRNGAFLPGGAPTTPGGPPTGGWGWVTGEPLGSFDWAAGEPNNANNNELYATHNTFGGKWNDIDFFGFGFSVSRMIVEFPGACITNVDIDIKPGSDPSSVSCKNDKGNVPVAIFGSVHFDVSTIDLSSLELNGVAVTEKHDSIHIEDLNDDGFDDAVLHLEKAGVCEATEGAPLKESVDAKLTGSTTPGPQSFEGTGDIQIVN